MNERFNFFSNNSDKKDDTTHTNGNGNGLSANSNGSGPLSLNGRYNNQNGNGNTNGRKDNGTTTNLNKNQPEPAKPTSLPPGSGRTTTNLNKNQVIGNSGDTPTSITTPPITSGGQPGHSVLSGTLTAFSPSSLLSLLSIQKQTGWLYFRNGGLNGFIYVDKGEVFDAGIGPVSSGALAIFQLFGWKQGEFRFEVGRPAPERRTIEVSLPVLQVRATLWLDNMNKYSQYIPSPSHLISIAAEPRSEVVIEPYQWAVLTKIVSRALSVAELAAELGQDLMTVTRITTELVKMGVAVVRPPEGQQ